MSRLRLSDSGRAVADVGGLVPGDRELSQCKFLIALTSICEAHHRYRGTEKSIDDEVHLKNDDSVDSFLVRHGFLPHHFAAALAAICDPFARNEGRCPGSGGGIFRLHHGWFRFGASPIDSRKTLWAS